MFVGLRKCGRMVTCFLVNYCKLLELPNEHIVQLSKINRFAVETQVISHHKVASRVLIEEKYIRTWNVRVLPKLNSKCQFVIEYHYKLYTEQ